MRAFARLSGVCLGLLVCLAAAAVAQTAADKYLTAADVEKTAGIKGVKPVARMSVPGAAGDLNFVNASGELILMVQISDAKTYDTFRKKYTKTVSGVGDQAVEGAMVAGMPDNLLAFTKGTRCVVLTSFGDFANNTVYLNIGQLTALGKLVASRL